jgi:MtN3 and saliva related transmembrane protein
VETIGAVGIGGDLLAGLTRLSGGTSYLKPWTATASPVFRGQGRNRPWFYSLDKRRRRRARPFSRNSLQMSQILADGVGVAAAALSMSSFVPQIVKILRERDASAVSTRMYLVTVSGFMVWIAYGVMIKSWPIAGSNLVNLGLSGTILVLKWRFGEKEPS